MTGMVSYLAGQAHTLSSLRLEGKAVYDTWDSQAVNDQTRFFAGAPPRWIHLPQGPPQHHLNQLVPVNIGHRQGGHFGAVAQHRHVVADLEHLGQTVRNEDHHATCFAHPS